ncbi:MAG TPA: sigma-70 family RNA polymerase sigma factor [Bryobacteraceae bacterium]|nr:sigma-70 family RNA polymerase sigma factor [Bryobacteraceae bacterium]
MAEEFEAIVREYQDRIFRLACSILGDRASAEEAAQEALVRIWKGLPGFRGQSSLSTWIYAITRNTCFTLMGRWGPRTESLEDPAGRREAERRSAATWPAAPVPDVMALVDRLPAKYRQVVALFYMQEKSYDEVANMLGLPVGTVKTYLFRARKSMAEDLARGRVRKGEANGLPGF